jgi:hypothetical protein
LYPRGQAPSPAYAADTVYPLQPTPPRSDNEPWYQRHSAQEATHG